MFFPHLIKLLFMVVKEYLIGTNGKPKQLQPRLVLLLLLGAVIICLLVTMYLEEQASTYLSAHNNLLEKNIALTYEVNFLKDDIASLTATKPTCEEGTSEACVIPEKSDQ